ncbi:carbonic anhydrase [Nocardioides ferulae]|uniref:carbonic anhydrase n=1 Tax=Nocardioides ferulae TaxID=2340821 RepID=UPI0013DDA60B|nr:carbonic anhydrase family protein [Nocardioides ferulae]
MPRRLSCLVVALVLAAAGCGGSGDAGEAAPEPAGHEDSPAHWDYADPAAWGELDPAYAACASGRAQSPVDLTGTEPVTLPDPALDYPASAVEVLDNGHTYQVTPMADGAATMRFEGRTWQLLQWHVHTPSEHLVDGEPAAAEIHLVHQEAGGDLAVLGVLVEEGAASAAVQPVLDALPTAEGDTSSVTDPVRLRGLLPRALGTVRYAGSLTTPPCTEGVRWLVATEPVTWSAQQVAAVTDRFAGNARPAQPGNGRSLEHDHAG